MAKGLREVREFYYIRHQRGLTLAVYLFVKLISNFNINCFDLLLFVTFKFLWLSGSIEPFVFGSGSVFGSCFSLLLSIRSRLAFQDTFVPIVGHVFLTTDNFKKYQTDIVFDKHQTQIVSSRMFLELTPKGVQERLFLSLFHNIKRLPLRLVYGARWFLNVCLESYFRAAKK